MSKFPWIVPALVVLLAVHVFGMIWCIKGGMEAKESDRRALQAVVQPLRASEAITPAGVQALEENGEPRSVIHATVMYSYAAVHGVTALALFAAVVAIRRLRESRLPV
ncbi:MAG: hypothetical protein ACREJD_16825 [Phycisphaerales bacterium]